LPDVDSPWDSAVDTPSDGPLDTIADTAGDTSVDTAVDTSTDTAPDTALDTAGDTPVDTAGDDGSTGCTGTLLSSDFETGDGGFTESPGDTVWEWGAIVSGAPSSGHGNVWATNLSGNYGACENAFLTSTTLDLSACGGVTITLTFDTWYEYEQYGLVYYDGFLVEMWNGSAWVQVAPVGGWDHRVDIYGCSGIHVEGKDCFAHESGGWLAKTFTSTLTSYPSDFKFRFVHGSDVDGHYDGAFIDNVLLTASP
jgi:hypothetical protein